MSHRIYVDFNTMNQDLWSEERRVAIYEDDLKPHFRPGMHVILYDSTLEVAAILELDEQTGHWWARPDWSTIRDLPYP